MAVSAQALIDEAARLKERYPEADHVAMAEAVLAERERAAAIAELEGVSRDLNVWGGGPSWYRHGKRIAQAIRGGHQ